MKTKDTRPNNFDLIRLIAATQVILGHTVEHLQLTGPLQHAWSSWVGWFPGVPIFFVISGFLISLSFEHNPELSSYLRNRFLRIYPALWVCAAVSAGTILVLYPHARLVSWEQLLLWASAQLTIGQSYNPGWLRGYATGVANGSLWTIPVELQFYLLVPLGYAGLRLERGRGTARLLALGAAFVLLNRMYVGAMPALHDHTAFKLAGATFVPFFYMFLVGVLIQRNFPRVRWLFEGTLWYWLAIYVATNLVLHVFGLTVQGNYINPLSALVLAGVVMAAAYTRPSVSELLLRGNDISYGAYLYHMVVINALLTLGHRGDSRLLGVVLFLTYGIAILSWVIVERPLLRYKERSLRSGGTRLGTDGRAAETGGGVQPELAMESRGEA